MPPSDYFALAVDPVASIQVREPRLNVLVNSVPLATATDVTVTSTAFFSADRFRVQGALVNDAFVWAGQTYLFVDVQVALSPVGPFISVVQGNADLISIDPIAGTLLLEGRDRSADLIEARTQETFANRTSSEIASILAGRHDLAANVQPTTTPVGRYWELEHDSLTLNAAGRATTEWDLLVMLARRENFDLWVGGTTLNFFPRSVAPPVPLPLSLTTSLRLDRSLTFAGDILVTVKSWHSRQGTACLQTAQTNRGSVSSKEYVFIAPNLTPDAAQAYAETVLSELTSHELVATIEMPGELAITPRMPILLQGTNTIFDTVLRVDEVERRFNGLRGFTQRLRARAATAI